ISRTGELRATWELQHGRTDDARDDLAATFVMGRQSASDGLLIGTLVQFAIESLHYAIIAENFRDLPPETLEQLDAAFAAAPPRHTVANAMPSEKRLGDWILDKVLELQKAHPGDDAKVMAEFRSSIVPVMDSVGFTNFWPKLVSA